ncbi:VP13A-like protein [Mya arenaria]|uniref:VP13A-like protein n=1 Tax=Mya arenaria TaxID=6604 RepID=A0ABY7EA22_MYAAR|nr:VP13A-like protein [Mya arenaria]
MFEGVVSYLLNKVLGKYVQNLDAANLRVSIFSGDVELRDLKLKTEALAELKLPIEVKAGYIGYIKVDIPWTGLFSSSVIVNVEDVYLLAGPISDRVYNPEQERALQNAIKREILDSLELSKPAGPSMSEDPGFLEKMYTYAINNMQVSVGRVHLRYEDTITNPDHPFACGVMLKHISAYTTDSKWLPAQMDNAATIIHKLLEMRELSVYWNPYIPEQHLVRTRTNTDGWRNMLMQAILNHRIMEEDFDFIVEPVSAEVRLIISQDNNLAIPKLFTDVTLEDIEILLSRQQFLNILSLKDSFQMMSVNQKYRKYHPNVPLKISPRSWWVYAYTAVVEERIRPYSFERIKAHREKYREYKNLYSKYLSNRDDKDITERLAELEGGLDVANIVMAREQAKEEFAPEKIVKKKKPSGWFSWLSKDEEEEEVDIDLETTPTSWMSKLSEEEKAELYRGIGYDENANIKKAHQYKVQVNLKSCCLSLVNYSKKILQMTVTQMLASLETRPGNNAYRLSCNTESFTVEGASIEHELIPIVTSDVNVYAPSVNQVFTLDFESQPQYVEADFSLKMNVQPVEVVYDEHSVCEVRAFFQLPTRTLDMRAVAMETTVHLAVQMKSPYVVIPEFGTLHRGGNVLIADLGMLQIKSELQPKDAALEYGNLSESEIAAHLYDQFTVNITNVKVLLADSGDDWHTAQIQPTSKYHILPSMKLTVDFYNSVKPSYKQLPQQKVITTLPTFEVSISDHKLLVLWKFYNNFTVTSSASMHHLGDDMVDGAPATDLYTLDPNELQLDPNMATLRSMKQSILGRRVVDKSKRKPKLPRLVSDEVDIPYDDEQEETKTLLQKYEEVKPVDDISSHHNTANIVVRVIVREVVIHLSKVLDGEENPYLMFRADRLRLDAAMTEYGLCGHASLGAIQLVDKIHVGTSGAYMELMSTKPGTDLVSILYRQVSPDCPDFSSTYSSVRQAVRLQFETLNVLVDQGAFMHLRTYLEGITSSMQTADMMRSSSTAASSSITTATDAPGKNNKQADSPVDETVDERGTVQWNILFDLHDVCVTLADNNSKIAEIHIKDLRGHGLQRREKLVLLGSLKDIDVKDCSHGALYRDRFTEPLVSPEVKDTAAVALMSVSKQVGTFHEENRRFGLNVTMVTPTILIPIKSDSPDLLILKSGDLHVQNEFDFTDVGQGLKQEWNHVYVSLSRVQLSRAELSRADETFNIVSHILEPMTFQTDVRIALEPEMADVQTDMTCSLGKEGENADLSRLLMGKISGTASLHGDGETKVTVALETLAVINTKPNTTLVEKRVLYYNKSRVDIDGDLDRPLVSIIYKVSGDGNQKADIMMEKVTINIQIPYILELSDFFTCALTSPVSPAPPQDSLIPGPLPALVVDGGPVMTVYCSVKQPELVILADPGSNSSRIIVINADITFDFTSSAVEQRLSSKVSMLQMFSSIYGKASEHKSKMLSPCEMEFSREYNVTNNKLDMAVKMKKIYVHFTPPNIRLLRDVIEILQQSFAQSSESLSEDTTVPEVKDMWKIKPITPEKWIEKYNDGESVAPMFGPAEAPIETMTVDVEEVCAFFEVENLDQTAPLLCVRTSIDMKLTNWTKQMRMLTDLELDVCYYNERLSVWEPLIEPNMVQEGNYEPWALKIQADVQNLISRSQFRSSSSDNDADEELDSPNEMTILRPKITRRKMRIASDKSYESLSRHSSVQGESDSENESLIHTITSKLGSIFNTDSSEDADVSETDDNDDSVDWTLDKPIFLTPQGPVKFRTGPEHYDDVDGGLVTMETEGEEVSPGSMCTYMVLSSPDKLLLNVTPPAINALDKTQPEGLMDIRKLPAFEMFNKTGLDADIVVHKSVKVHSDYVHMCQVCHPGDMRLSAPPTDDIITEEPEEEEEDDVDGASLSSQKRPLTFVTQTLADAGHTLVSAGAFVFDDDVLFGTQIDKDSIQIQVSGFEPTSSLLMNRACRRLVSLNPKQNGCRYWVVFDVDCLHSHRTVTFQSPLQVWNSLTTAVDVLVRVADLSRFPVSNLRPIPGDEFVKLGTVAPDDVFPVPLFPAFHCALFIAPSELSYENTSSIWWQDLVHTKDRQTYLSCQSTTGDKPFNIRVCLEEGEPLRPPQMLTRTVPYYTLSLLPPVVLHNHLPYDLQFSLESSENSISLTHGENTPLYNVNMNQTYKLNLFVSDYMTCDWRGTLDITREMEEFKAVSMDTDLDPDNNNKHLSLGIHCAVNKTWNLYIYSPYWIVNKTDLSFQIRGSMSDVALECQPSGYPQLFRYKKNKRKKAKLRVYESNWSHAFSLDTVGNSGVVECLVAQRHRKYTFMVQCQLSKLKLTKIITVLPFFLVVNTIPKPLRYMEENKNTDLWFDLAPKQCSPFWPVTECFNMYVKYERSNVVSQHFPFRTSHNTVLRMENGTAVCVNVSGGTQSPITIQFSSYDVGDAPVRVENLCEDVFIKVHQKNQSQTTVLSSNQCILYTWDDPTSERTLMWNVYGRSKLDYPAAIMKATGTFDYVDAPDANTDSSPEDESDETDGLVGSLDTSLIGKTRSDKLVIYWVSYLDNKQRVLLFTQDERVAKGARQMNEAEQANLVVFISLDGVCVSVINKAYEEVALLSISSPPATWEVEVNRWKMLNVELQTWLEDQWRNQQQHASLQEQFEADLVKMQMLKPYMGALRRSYSPGLWFNFRRSQHHVSLHARVQRIQLDNQLPDAYFPTVLHPCPIPVYVLKKKGQKPFIEFGMMRRTVPENNVDTFRYVKCLVQEFNFKVDKGFILSLYDVFALMVADYTSESVQLQSDLMFTQKSLQEVAAVMIHSNQDKMFFEYLRLSPMKMHISFSLNGTPHMSQENQPTIVSDIIDFLLGSVGATFTEMKDVELKMAFFEVKGQSLSSGQLMTQVKSHYTHQFIQQAYVLILGLDVLGNPYGLIKDFTQGFGDLFYEPFLDSVQGSDELSESLKRRAVMQQRPSNLPLSLALAGRGFVMGVCLGLSGVILDPIRGAQEEGVEGFFKGIGKGIMGLLTKPTGGVFDMVSMAFDGMQRAAELEGAVVHRMRKPRFINMYLGLRPYSGHQAVGANLLLTVNKGQFAKTDTYWAHAQLSPGDRADVLLITTRHIVLLGKHRCWGGWDVEWEVKLESILGVPAVTSNKLIFKVKQDENSMNVFAGGEQEISCDDPDLLLWLQHRIENLIKYRQR